MATRGSSPMRRATPAASMAISASSWASGISVIAVSATDDGAALGENDRHADDAVAGLVRR